MATTNNEIVLIASAVADCSRLLKALNSALEQTLARNTVEALDWGGVDAAAADAALQEKSKDYTAAEVSNAIGSLAAFQTFWTTHGPNFQKLTSPIV